MVLSLLLLFAVSSLSMFSAPSASATGVGAAVEVFPGPRPVSSYAPLSVLSVLCVSLGFLVSRLSSIFFFFVFFSFSFEFPVSPESPVSAFSFIYDDDCVCMLLVAVIQR